MIYPCGKIACTQDGVFFSQLYPRGPARTDLVVGFAYPRSTVATPNFEAIVAKYYHRCDISIPEDNNIAEVQQRGLESPLASPSRVSLREPIVNYFANWLLDRVLVDSSEANQTTRDTRTCSFGEVTTSSAAPVNPTPPPTFARGTPSN